MTFTLDLARSPEEELHRTRRLLDKLELKLSRLAHDLEGTKLEVYALRASLTLVKNELA